MLPKISWKYGKLGEKRAKGYKKTYTKTPVQKKTKIKRKQPHDAKRNKWKYEGKNWISVKNGFKNDIENFNIVWSSRELAGKIWREFKIFEKILEIILHLHIDEYENRPEGESRAPRLSTELKVRFRAEIAWKPVHFRSLHCNKIWSFFRRS